jgi:NAD(P)-dependent dehydrogenase (short-subunit alcohol dehydrogenase family)
VRQQDGLRPVTRTRVALLTGAANGIGRATARALAGAGWRLALLDRDGESLEHLARELGDGATALFTRTVDITDTAAVDAAVAAAHAALGPFTAVCPIAGVFAAPERPMAEMADADVARLLDVNVHGTVRTLRACIPLIRDGGSIAVAASTSGLTAHPDAAVYGATKAALVALARSLALELAPRRVRVNAVCPGGVDTPLSRAAYPEEAASGFAGYRETNPLGRIATPDDVAAVFAFLASDAARHVNGVALRVDGGDSVMGWV